MSLASINRLFLKPVSALVLTAHPDDETIWMGGTILLFPKIRWTIFSLCRSNDPDRTPKFKKACTAYNANAVISDLEDKGIMNIKESIPEIKKRIKKELPQKNFDYIFTHAANGEYGHPRHKGVHQTICALANSHWLQVRQVFCFSYKLDEKKEIAVPNEKRASHVLRLPQKVFSMKRRIVHELYGFPKKSFEYRSCSHIETFNLLWKQNMRARK